MPLVIDLSGVRQDSRRGPQRRLRSGPVSEGVDVEYVKSRNVSLRTHPDYSEKWLQQQIVDDPSLLGLGPLEVKAVERRQPRAGRLDLLLSDPEANVRYEVEIQLGATDESHIIRTIEYWDLEKSRYPQYDHVAVIVAEDITSRFLNVIALLNRSIPVIAIQLRALEVGNALTLSATTVLDLTPPADDDEDDPGVGADRAYWVQKGSEATVRLAGQLLDVVNDVVPGMDLKYNRHYIGLAKAGMPDNFVTCRAQRQRLVAGFRIPRSDELTEFIENNALDLMRWDRRSHRYMVRLEAEDFSQHRDALLELVRRANEGPDDPED